MNQLFVDDTDYHVTNHHDIGKRRSRIKNYSRKKSKKKLGTRSDIYSRNETKQNKTKQNKTNNKTKQTTK